MSKIFLIDTENVNFNAIINARDLSEDDMIILFLTIITNKHFDKIKLDALNTKAKVLKVFVDTGTKNSLDFQLVSYLGFMLGEHKEADNHYYIVSKDRGYLSSINLLINCSNQNLELVDSIADVIKNTDTDYVLDTLTDKFEQQGFLRKTAKKMALLTTSNDCYEDTLDTFNVAFGYNFDVIERCKPVLNLYFNRDVEEVI